MLYGTIRNWLLLSLAMFKGPIGWTIIPAAGLLSAAKAYFFDDTMDGEFFVRILLVTVVVSWLLALLISALLLVTTGFKKSPGGWRGYARLRGAALRSYHQRLLNFTWNIASRVADGAEF